MEVLTTNRFAHLRGVPIAVDFDGTCVEHHFPDVGPDVPGAVEILRELSAAGAKLILWTMRSQGGLNDARVWFGRHNISLSGLNHNPGQHRWTNSPKAYAKIYIDDAALGCPLIPGRTARKEVEDGTITDGVIRPMVDWQAVARMLEKGEHA